MLREFLIQHGENDDREGSESDIVELINDWLIQGLSTERGGKSVPELRHDEENILVEHVDGQDRVSAVSLTSMVEKKRLEERELRNRIV